MTVFLTLAFVSLMVFTWYEGFKEGWRQANDPTLPRITAPAEKRPIAA